MSGCSTLCPWCATILALHLHDGPWYRSSHYNRGVGSLMTAMGGRKAPWCCCRSNRTDSLFIQMCEEVWYDYRLFAMLRHLQRSFLRGDEFQYLIVSHVDLCCLDYRARQLGFASLDFNGVPSSMSSIFIVSLFHAKSPLAVRTLRCMSFARLTGLKFTCPLQWPHGRAS